MKKKTLLLLFSLFIALACFPLLSGAQTEEPPSKLKFIAGMFASRLNDGTVSCGLCHKDMTVTGKTVAFDGFKDFKGNPSEEGKGYSDEFLMELSAALNPVVKIVSGSEGLQAPPDVVINGILVPFKGKEKWKLSIKAVTSDGRVIAVYDGILRVK